MQILDYVYRSKPQIARRCVAESCLIGLSFPFEKDGGNYDNKQTNENPSKRCYPNAPGRGRRFVPSDSCAAVSICGHGLAANLI